MSKPPINAMDERLERLERECRRWRWAGIASISALAIALVAGAVRQDEVPKVIHAEGFVAVDKERRGVIEIGSSIQKEGRGLIEFLDKAGKRRMAIGLRDADKPFIMLTDPDGREQLNIDVEPDLGMAIAIRNLQRNSGLLLGTGPNGVAALGFMGEGGKQQLEMGVNPDGSARLTLRDKGGKDLFQIPKP